MHFFQLLQSELISKIKQVVFSLGLSDMTVANKLLTRVVRFTTHSKMMRHEWLVQWNSIKLVNLISHSLFICRYV